MYTLLKVLFVFCFSSWGYVQGFGLLQNVRYSDQCLRMTGHSVDNDVNLEITTCDPAQTDQQFDVECWANYATVPGPMKFILSKKCLSVKSSGTENGVLLTQKDCVDKQSNQMWKILGSYDGDLQLQNVGSSKCITSEGTGGVMHQWTCEEPSTVPHQTWRIVNKSVPAEECVKEDPKEEPKENEECKDKKLKDEVVLFVYSRKQYE